MAEYDGAGAEDGGYEGDQMSKTWSWNWQEGEMKAEMTCVHPWHAVDQRGRISDWPRSRPMNALTVQIM